MSKRVVEGTALQWGRDGRLCLADEGQEAKTSAFAEVLSEDIGLLIKLSRMDSLEGGLSDRVVRCFHLEIMPAGGVEDQGKVFCRTCGIEMKWSGKSWAPKTEKERSACEVPTEH